MKETKNVHKNIKFLIENLKVNRLDMAEHTGIAPPMISNYMNGRLSLRLSTLCRICKYLGVTIDQIMDVDPLVDKATGSIIMDTRGVMKETPSVDLLSSRLRGIRKNAGMHANELARAIGRSQSYISDLEVNKRDPGIETIIRLCKVLKVKPSELLGLTEFRPGGDIIKKTVTKPEKSGIIDEDTNTSDIKSDSTAGLVEFLLNRLKQQDVEFNEKLDTLNSNIMELKEMMNNPERKEPRGDKPEGEKPTGKIPVMWVDEEYMSRVFEFTQAVRDNK